jgi:FADH2 O2-dependent halogenase
MGIDHDVIIIGGGPAGSVLASLLARDGRKVLVVEKDIHPREHVGEALTPSVNVVLQEIGFLDKMEEVGFTPKPGVVWTTPAARTGKFVWVRTADYPFPKAPRPYSFNVERDQFDAMLLRHAHELGATVLQGVSAKEVVFEDGRAVGARISGLEGWEHEARAKVIVDASGRRCLIPNQLGLRQKDPTFNQFGIYSWFKGVADPPEGFAGYLFLHFLGLERAWAWQIPMRNGITSVGVVTEKGDFQKSGRSHEDFFDDLIRRNRSLWEAMEGAERVRPWYIEADYTYKNDTITGDGWLLIGDALRFIDPVFSTGVDVAVYSALHARDAISSVLDGGDEKAAFGEFEHSVTLGVETWYELTTLFYDLQIIFTLFAVGKRFKERLVRTLQGNLYMPETLGRAQELIGEMRDSYAKIMANPDNLLRPGTIKRLREKLGGPGAPTVVPAASSDGDGGAAAGDGFRVADRLREFILDELSAPVPGGGLAMDTNLLSGLIDSGGLMRIAVFIEEEFGVEIEDDDIVAQHFSTLADIDRLVVSKLNALRSS